ncbi:MAG: hypothetical protein EA360_03670 [Balneolaceae bacterium]|nr:MAG: hypothetical protein EA360_03670 [Balneolaceae bacterium]
MTSKKRKGKEEKTTVPALTKWFSRDREILISLCILFLLPFFLYHSTILGGQQYMGHDVIQWRAGAESLMQHQQEAGETAHWAANMFSGMPATTISHPPQLPNLDNTVLRALRFIYPAAEMWILLAGGFVMLLLMGMRPFSALFGAVIIGFSTYIPIIIGAGHNAKFLSYIYIPWIYIGYLLMKERGESRWLALFIFALALTLHLRAYHPQVTYFFLFPIGALYLTDLVKAVKAKDTHGFAAMTAWLAGGAVIALLISAQLYWSTFEYSQFSMRGGSELAETTGLAREYAFAWSQGWGELLTLLIPGAYGGAEYYWGPKTFTSGPHYAGALGFLFFLVGAVKSRHHLKFVFLAPGLVTLLFSLGEHFGALNNVMFGYFPLFDKFRVPEMWLMVTVFCFAVVAAMGVEWISDQVRSQRGIKPLMGAVWPAVALAAVAIFITFQFLTFEKPGERESLAERVALQNNVSQSDPGVVQAVNRIMLTQLIPEREEMAHADAIRFGLFLILGIGLIALMALQRIPAEAGLIALSLVLAWDLIRVDSRYLSEHSLVEGHTTRESVIEQRERPHDRFIIENIGNEEGWPYRVLPFLDNPFNNALPSYFYPTIGGYSGAKLGYYQDVLDEAFVTEGRGLNTELLNMLNVRFISLNQPISLPGYRAVFQDVQGAVLENLEVLPKAFFVDSVSVLSDQRAVLEQLKSDFRARELAFVADREPPLIRPDTSATVSVIRYSANAISMAISRSEPGFLVLGEIWFPPGWKATIQGMETEIIRTNYILRGFEVPAGEYTLELGLNPVWYRTGKRLSAAGSGLLFGSFFAALSFLWKRRNDEVAEEERKE